MSIHATNSDEMMVQSELQKHLKSLSTIIKSEKGLKENVSNLDQIKKQPWYFIKFQSFCKSELNGDPRKNYYPYFVLAEVIF